MENNHSNYIDSGGPHVLFNGDSSVWGPSSSFVLQLLESVFPHYKKSFLELGFSSLEKSSTWVHGFWPSWADAPAASQKCWVGVEMQQSCHCKLEKEKKKPQNRGFIYHWRGLVTSSWLCRGTLIALLVSHSATWGSACGWWEVLKSIFVSTALKRKEKLGLPRGNVSWWCWFRIAVTRLLPGLANRVTPLFRETSEAYNIRGKAKNDQNWPSVAHQSAEQFLIITSVIFRMVRDADWLKDRKPAWKLQLYNSANLKKAGNSVLQNGGTPLCTAITSLMLQWRHQNPEVNTN